MPMRAQFIRHNENPLDTLDIGRVEERKMRKYFSELKNDVIIPFMKKNKFNPREIRDFYYKDEKSNIENVGLNFMETMKKKECEYIIGYSEGNRGFKMFLCGYNLGDGNWIWERREGSSPSTLGKLEDCLEQIKKWIKEGI
jgi:hypothetical protein